MPITSHFTLIERPAKIVHKIESELVDDQQPVAANDPNTQSKTISKAGNINIWIVKYNTLQLAYTGTIIVAKLIVLFLVLNQMLWNNCMKQ